MRKKIVLLTSTLCGLAILLTSVLLVFFLQRSYEADRQEALRLDATNIAAVLNAKPAFTAYEEIALENDHRITVFDATGNILYDTTSGYSYTNNLFDRPEVREAILSGFGEATRMSTAFQVRTFYYAVRLSDGRVIRLACRVNGFMGIFSTFTPVLILFMCGILLLVSISADHFSRRMLRPIRTLDLESPADNKTYEELAPLLQRMVSQNSIIASQEKLLAYNSARFAAITQNIQEGLITATPDGGIVSCNQSSLRILSIPAELENSLFGQHLAAMSKLPNFLQAIRTVQHGENAMVSLEINGRYIQMTGHPIYLDGEMERLVFVLTDMTEYEERGTLRREFSANVSHELKSPLTSISGYAKMIDDGVIEAEEFPIYAKRIYKEAQLMTQLIEDIISLSRLDENNLTFEKEMIDLYKSAGDICERLSGKADAHQVQLQLVGASAEMSGIPYLLNEILYNLIDNAIKYNKPGGYVEIRIVQEDDKAIVTVEDNGIGIPLEEQPRIFERFYRADKTRGSAVEGTGLGLSIVKHAVINHDAKITLDSTPDVGTTITVEFPL